MTGKTTAGLQCLVTLLSVTAVLTRPGSFRSLSATGTIPLPTVKCPPPCQCNKTGTTVSCEGKSLTSIPHGIPPTVEELYLDHNSFVTLQQGALSNLTHLRKVSLRNNQIQTFQSQTFCNLPLLRELYLANNNITSLPPDTFEGVDSLSLLNLDANKLESVPDLRTLPGLKELYLEGNQIKDATFPAGFANVKSLHTIVLSSNNILTLTNETFAVLTNSSLSVLYIVRNGLRNISVGALRPLGSLQSLKIGVNPLDGVQLEHVLHGLSDDLDLQLLDIRNIQLGGALPSHSFSILSRTSLKNLNFKKNRVRKIPQRAFAHLPKLAHLDLSECHVQTVENNAFVDLPDLRTLFLNNNQDLITVPSNLPTSLRKLHLQYNGLERLQDGVMQNLSQLGELYLSNNKIHEVSENSFLGLTNLRILHLENNLLSYIPKKLFAPLPKLKKLILKNNNIKFLKPNPGAMASLASLTYLDMSGNQCSHIPFDFLADLTSLQTLNLDDNVLGGLLAGDTHGRLLANTSKLQVLSLKNNNIQYIHDAQFRNLHALQQLNLKNNRLSSWGPDLFHTAGKTLTVLDLSSNQIALINRTSVHNLQKLKTLNLSLNPFACTCDLRWFRTWLDYTTINVANKTTYKCNSPPEWNGKPLSDFGPDKINCIDYTWYYVGGAIGLTLIVAFIICYIVCRHRWFIRLRFYRLGKAMREGRYCSRRGRRDGDNVIALQGFAEKRYDFYIIAAEEDTEWVCDKLLPKLDNGPTVHDQHQHYQGQFSLYFEARDALEGRTKIASFDENMPASKAVLIVLTGNLGRDKWCHFLIDEAYTLKTEGCIQSIQIIMVDACIPPLRHIPQRLHRAVERGDYIEWPDTADQNFLAHLEDVLLQGLA